MIIAINGKIGSGKDTVGSIIQYLTQKELDDYPLEDFLSELKSNSFDGDIYSDYKIKKFADKLKDIVCLLIGCTREQLEDQDFKNKPLGEEWIHYGYADGFDKQHRNGKIDTIMNHVSCDRERYELELRTNWQTAYKYVHTPRTIIQALGTECGRNIIHPDIWVNSLMSEYDKSLRDSYGSPNVFPDTNWIITDMRFPNEFKAVKDRNGITLKVHRYDITGQGKISNHESETALDNAPIDFHISNFGTIEELIVEVKEVLIQVKIL